MTSFPQDVSAALLRLMVEERQCATLLVDGDGSLIHSEGRLDTYGLAGLARHDMVADAASFLVGLIPLSGERLFLPKVTTENGATADVFLLSSDGGTWVVLLEAGTEADLQQRLQQEANEVRLLAEQLGRLTETDAPAGAASTTVSAQRDVAVCAVGLRDAQSGGAPIRAASLVEAHARWLKDVADLSCQRGGLMQAAAGDLAIVVFGAVPGGASAPAQALMAARDLVCSEGAPPAAAGLASGPAAVGPATAGWQGLLVTGQPLRASVYLEGQARAGEILADAETVSACDAARFAQVPPRRGGRVTAFTWRGG